MPTTVSRSAGIQALGSAKAGDKTFADVEKAKAELKALEDALIPQKSREAGLSTEVSKNKFTIEMLEEEIVETKQAKAMRDAKGRGGGTRSKAGLRKMPTEAKNLLPKTAVGDLYHEKVPTSKRPIEDFVLFEEIGSTYPEITLKSVLVAEGQFSEVDFDHDGEVSVKELEVMLAQRAISVNPDDLLKVINCFDTNSNQRIDYMEYLGLLNCLENESVLNSFKAKMDKPGAAALVRMHKVYKGESQKDDARCSVM